MATTTFTGPIRSGSIPDTSGTTLGSNVKNVGYAVLSQTQYITQNQAEAYIITSIVIPANSTIVSMQFLNTVAWSTGVTIEFYGVGQVVFDNSMPVGLVSLSPATGAASRWANVGSNDVVLYCTTGNTGDGEGKLMVTYIQGPH